MDRYELSKGKSQKRFWTWEVRGDRLVTTFGVAGGDSEEHIEPFASPEAAQRAAAAQVQKRTAKGYRRVDTGEGARKNAPGKGAPRAAAPAQAKESVRAAPMLTLEERAFLNQVHDTLRSFRDDGAGSESAWETLDALRKQYKTTTAREEAIVAEAFISGRFDDCTAPRTSRDPSAGLVWWLQDHARNNDRPSIRALFHALATGRLVGGRSLFGMRREEAIALARGHLADPRIGHRRAAVEVLDALKDMTSLPALEARASVEGDEGIFALIRATIHRLLSIAESLRIAASDPPAGTPEDEGEPDREAWNKLVAALVEHHLADEGWMTTSELARRTGFDEAKVERAMPAIARILEQAGSRKEEPFSRLSHLSRIVNGAPGHRLTSNRDIFFRLAAPDASALNRLLSARRYREVDRLLEMTGLERPAGFADAPGLIWLDGSPCSPGAMSFYLANLTSGPACALVDHAFTSESKLALGLFLLDPASPLKKEHRGNVPRGCDALVHELARRWESGRLTRAPYEIGGLDSPAFLRWCYRWWCTQRANGVRDTVRVQFVSQWPTVDIECFFPRGADPSGTEREWRAHVARVLERAMTDQRAFSFAHFRRCYLENPLAASVVPGVVFRAREQLVHFSGGHAEGARGAVDLQDDDELVVAHPAADTGEWPSGLPDAPFLQAHRPIFDDPPLAEDEQRGPIPHARWLERARDLDYVGLEEVGGGVMDTLRFVFHRTNPRAYTMVAFRHSGYGAGFGGAVPQTIYGVKLPYDAPRVLCSEVAYDLHRLAGDLQPGLQTT